MLTFPKLGLPLAPGGNSGFAGFLLPDSSRCEKDAVPKCPGPHLSFLDRKSTRLNSSHGYISYAVFCLKKKNKLHIIILTTYTFHDVYIPSFNEDLSLFLMTPMQLVLTTVCHLILHNIASRFLTLPVDL